MKFFDVKTMRSFIVPPFNVHIWVSVICEKATGIKISNMFILTRQV